MTLGRSAVCFLTPLSLSWYWSVISGSLVNIYSASIVEFCTEQTVLLTYQEMSLQDSSVE